MDALGFTFTLAIALAAIVLYGLHLYLDARRWEREERAERTELDGPMSELRAQSDERMRRAAWRHASRFSRRMP